MASVKKFDLSAVPSQLRHNERSISNPSNSEIDPGRSCLNYSLIPERPVSSYDYFLQRKSQLYCYNRPDVKVLAAWIITAPGDLAREDEQRFFSAAADFLLQRYGEENCIQAIVHQDEGGRPHLHFAFIPAVADPRHGGEKICANDVLNPRELRSFHPALQQHITAAGVKCKVLTGITQEIGGSVSVQDLKRAEKLIEHKRGFTW